ncbi:MAG: 5-formyltetrahydrofolate cyclo-ligase [Cyanobium sp.]
MTDPASSTAPPHPKEALRRRFRQLRCASLPAAAVGLLEVAQRELPALIPPGRRLGLWWPIGAEPDLRPLAVELQHRRPDALALPVVEPWPPGGSHLQLHYRPWIPGALLLPDACGIPAPAPAPAPGTHTGAGPAPPLPPGALALLLVPALAIDRSGIRLGSGGGWYDRLRADPAWRAVPALAVLPAACVSATPLPRDPWDVPFDGWLDEHGLHRLSSPPQGAPAGKVAGS